MKQPIILDSAYSTTQMVTKDKPDLANNLKDELPWNLSLPTNKDRIDEGGLRTKGYFKSSYSSKPLVSIITVVFNGAEYLNDTINSVINQSYSNIEYIIIDGGSMDRSLEIIKNYSDKIDYWVSEKDKGIYDAFNKGISLATGDYIGIISADDYYELSAVQTVVSEFSLDPNIDIVHGNMFHHNEKHKRKKLSKGLSLEHLDKKMCVNHPTVFVKKKLYGFHRFNLKYSLSSDYELIVKFNKLNYSFKHIDKILVHMRDGGASTTIFKGAYETFQIRKKHFGLFKASKAFLSRSIKKLIRALFTIVVNEELWVKKRFKD